MCGIAGLIRHDGLTVADRQRASRLCTLLRHRGPDTDGVAFTPVAALVQTRLALVDPAPYPLPLQSADGRYTLLFNGEIYNHSSLRRELAHSIAFRTCTDSEVVLAALLHWGHSALTHLEGMFSLFLWDNETHTGFAAVDPLSVKPFLYHASEDLFAFSSEAGPLIEARVLPFRPRDEAISEYLSAPFFSSARQLPFANLERLLPGLALEIDCGRVTTFAYPQRAFAAPSLLGALREAVATHAVADAPVGLFLSGGVDSSLLAALAPEPLPAFTIQYPNKAEHFADSLIVTSDDVPFARQVAERFAHPLRIIAPADFAAALLRTLRTNDLIAAWEQEVSQNVLAEAAARHVKAVLVGDAADETHYGYSFLLHPERLASPASLLDYFGHLPTRLPAAHFVDKYIAFTREQGHNWRTPDEQRLAITCLIRHLWLIRLLHNGDIHLMAHGVEGRVPFAHPEVLASGDQVSLADALAGGIEKHHLRTAAASLLPPEIAWRPKSALTKNLAARDIIHNLFREYWASHGALIEPYVRADEIVPLGPPADDRAAGLRFRLLALLVWFARFSS